MEQNESKEEHDDLDAEIAACTLDDCDGNDDKNDNPDECLTQRSESDSRRFSVELAKEDGFDDLIVVSENDNDKPIKTVSFQDERTASDAGSPCRPSSAFRPQSLNEHDNSVELPPETIEKLSSPEPTEVCTARTSISDEYSEDEVEASLPPTPSHSQTMARTLSTGETAILASPDTVLVASPSVHRKTSNHEFINRPASSLSRRSSTSNQCISPHRISPILVTSITRKTPDIMGESSDMPPDYSLSDTQLKASLSRSSMRSASTTRNTPSRLDSPLCKAASNTSMLSTPLSDHHDPEHTESAIIADNGPGLYYDEHESKSPLLSQIDGNDFDEVALNELEDDVLKNEHTQKVLTKAKTKSKHTKQRISNLKSNKIDDTLCLMKNTPITVKQNSQSILNHREPIQHRTRSTSNASNTPNANRSILKSFDRYSYKSPTPKKNIKLGKRGNLPGSPNKSFGVQPDNIPLHLRTTVSDHKPINKSSRQFSPLCAEERLELTPISRKAYVQNTQLRTNVSITPTGLATMPESPWRTKPKGIPSQLRSEAYLQDGKLCITVKGPSSVLPELQYEQTCQPPSLEQEKVPLDVKLMFVRENRAKIIGSNRKLPPLGTKKRTNIPADRNIVDNRASWPPFNTTLEPKMPHRLKPNTGNVDKAIDISRAYASPLLQ